MKMSKISIVQQSASGLPIIA